LIDAGGFEYAQARLQARYGARPDEPAWRRIEAIRELPALLDAARTCALAPWVAGLEPDCGVHRIETCLRMHWRALVAEVAGWMPGPWQRALAWCALLIDLPAIAYLWRGGVVHAWMRDDPVLRALCDEDVAARRIAIREGLLAPLAAGGDGNGALYTAWFVPWLAEWRRRWPEGEGEGAAMLEDCVRVIERHRERFMGGTPGETGPLRRRLETRLATLFRRAAFSPAAACAFLALSALDIERLRAVLAERAAFPHPELSS